MIDYIEGVLEARNVLADINHACLNHKYDEAIELCEQLIVVTRMLRNQIMIQADKK